jgi:hypothetical protein
MNETVGNVIGQSTAPDNETRDATAAPSGELPASGHNTVASCVVEAERTINAGRFEKGNDRSLKHGAYSKRVAAGLMPEQQAAREGVADRISAIVSDLGGLDELSALAVGEVQRHGRLELVEADGQGSHASGVDSMVAGA